LERASTLLRVIGVVVHPRRDIDAALDAVRDWVRAHDGGLGQIAVDGNDRRVCDDLVDVADCTLVLAVGGDGTVLAALHASAMTGVPVLGVSCGSLGALTSVAADAVPDALDRFAAGDWTARAIPRLVVEKDGTRIGEGFNDLVVVRGGAGQAILDIEVDGGTYAKVAGDGAIVSTALGSSAYTVAAGGPLLAASADAIVITPLSPHGGGVPSVVLGPETRVEIRVDPSWSGVRVEIDGRVAHRDERPGDAVAFRLSAELEEDAATLVDLGGETFIAGLRRRGVIADSPRVRARR
jgi:NAD+ kinase